MIISHVITAQNLSDKFHGDQVILRRALNDKGYQFQDLVKGTMTSFYQNDNNDFVLLITAKDGKLIDAIVKPTWAIIFPVDGAGHVW